MLHKMTNFFLIWNMGSFLIIFITILATNDHKQTPSFVFSEFQNFTGFNKPYAAILGLLQSAFGMCCYDAPAHMTEEINDARKVAPKAIILSVSLGAVTGFAFLIAACFCMGSIEGVAESATGDPIVQIFYDSTQSVAGASCLTFLMVMIQFFSAISLLAEGGRAVVSSSPLPMEQSLLRVKRHNSFGSGEICSESVKSLYSHWSALSFQKYCALPCLNAFHKFEKYLLINMSQYAFARDRGLPFSSTLSKVHPKKQVPIYGILLTFVVQIALNSIYFGTVTGFNTVVSIATEGFCKLINFPHRPHQILTYHRRLLRHTNPPPRNRTPHRLNRRSKNGRSVESRSLEYAHKHHGVGISTLHIHNLQFPQYKPGGFGKHELHICCCGCGYGYGNHYLVHHSEESIYRAGDDRGCGYR